MITSFIPLFRCRKMFESCSLCDDECDHWPSNDDLFGRPGQTCSSPQLRSADRFASRHLRSVSTSQSELLCRSLHISKCNGSLTTKLGACQTNGLVSDHFKELISLIPTKSVCAIYIWCNGAKDFALFHQQCYGCYAFFYGM